ILSAPLMTWENMMNRNFVLALSAMLLSCAAPAANAADATATPAATTTTTTTAPAAAAPAPAPAKKNEVKKAHATTTAVNTSETTMHAVAMAPVRGAALVTGAVFGTPIAVVRKVAEESIDATKTVAHNSDNKAVLAAASVVGIPIGLFVGG